MSDTVDFVENLYALDGVFTCPRCGCDRPYFSNHSVDMCIQSLRDQLSRCFEIIEDLT